MDASRFEAAIAFAGAHSTRGAVIIYRGRIVAEHYWKGWDPTTVSVISSATKNIVSVLVGMCIDDGAIASLNQSVAHFLPGWQGKPQEAITIRHLLSMTSGLSKPALWTLWTKSPNSALDDPEFGMKLALSHTPGTDWEYHTIAYRLLFPIIERATGRNLSDYTRERLFDPIGMEHSYWRSRISDGVPCYHNLVCSARDMARFGQLVSQYGAWEGKQVVSRAYLEEALRPSQDLNPFYGYLFWLNGPQCRLLPDCPADAVMAMGAQDTRIYIVPSLALSVARLGDRVSPREGRRQAGGNREGFHNAFLRMVCSAVEAGGAPSPG